jgi:hypothetical protein
MTKSSPTSDSSPTKARLRAMGGDPPVVRPEDVVPKEQPTPASNALAAETIRKSRCGH